MKSTLITVLASATTLVSAISAPKVDGMKVIWKDTFEGVAGADPSKEWTIARDINTNAEHQVYSDSNKNIQLSGGNTLQLVPWLEDDGWTSGRVETKDSWEARNGKKIRYEASFRFGDAEGADERTGMWPAFWMMGDAVRQGTEWPRCGELDIYEGVNGTALGTVHCGVEGEGEAKNYRGGPCDAPNGKSSKIPAPSNDFHAWSLTVDRTSGNWREETITWAMDGTPFHVKTGAEIEANGGDEGVWSTLAHSPYYMILNVAVGGHLVGDPDKNTVSGYGNMMEIGYVAVYESS